MWVSLLRSRRYWLIAHEFYQEMFPPFIDIEPSTSLLKQGAFGILVQGLGLDDGGHDQTSVILHPVFNMFELRGGLVRNESGHPQLMLAGKLALPRGSKAMAWPVSLFKNFVRVPNEDIRGYAVFAFARSVGSSSSPGLRAQIVGRGKKAMVADGACPMVVNFPIAQEDPEWGPVIILNQKGASSPWYAHCKQRKSDRAIFCLYCSHAYGVKAGAKSQKKNPDDADDMEEDGGDSDGEGSAKDAKLKIPNAKGGMTSNIKRHVIGHHSEELQNNDVTGAPFPPCNPVGSELLGFLLEQQPPPWDYDDPAMGMTAAYAIHPAIAFEEIKAEPAGAQGFTLSGRIVLISKDRSSVDLIINWENVFPRAPDYRTQTSVHVFQRLVPMELKGGQEIQQAHAMRMQSAPFEWIVWIRLL